MTEGPNAEAIRALIDQAFVAGSTKGGKDKSLEYLAAADVLEVHDATGVDLHQWPHVREWIENLTGTPVIATDSPDERIGESP